MTIAILGASGHLGRKTLDAVIDRGVAPEEVVAAVRTPAKMSSWAERGIQIRAADYDDPESLNAAFEGVDKLLLVPSVSMPVDRVRQYENAIAAAKTTGVRHLLHYGLVPTSVEAPFVVTPFLVYAEAALRTSGLAWTMLRNSLYADPIAEWVPTITKLGTIPYPTGSGRCAYISRDDIARAGAAALTTEGHEGKVYNITGPTALTTADLCDAVSAVTGQSVEDRGATDEDYRRACLAEGEPEMWIHVLLTLYHTIREGHLDVATDDVEKLTGRPAQSFQSLLEGRMQAS